MKLRDVFVGFAVVLVLSVDGWGCGALAGGSRGGWCCDGVCELNADERLLMDYCTCDGFVTRAGDCERR